jgi:hypothetical protein
MESLLVPDLEALKKDIRGIVADYVNSLVKQPGADIQRETLIQRIVPACEQLMQLLQDANAQGWVDELVLVSFMRDLVTVNTRFCEETEDATRPIEPRTLQ